MVETRIQTEAGRPLERRIMTSMNRRYLAFEDAIDDAQSTFVGPDYGPEPDDGGTVTIHTDSSDVTVDPDCGQTVTVTTDGDDVDVDLTTQMVDDLGDDDDFDDSIDVLASRRTSSGPDDLFWNEDYDEDGLLSAYVDYGSSHADLYEYPQGHYNVSISKPGEDDYDRDFSDVDDAYNWADDQLKSGRIASRRNSCVEQGELFDDESNHEKRNRQIPYHDADNPRVDKIVRRDENKNKKNHGLKKSNYDLRLERNSQVRHLASAGEDFWWDSFKYGFKSVRPSGAKTMGGQKDSYSDVYTIGYVYKGYSGIAEWEPEYGSVRLTVSDRNGEYYEDFLDAADDAESCGASIGKDLVEIIDDISKN